MKKVFLNSLLEIKGIEPTVEDPSVLKIAGYANYATKDRGNEVIMPEAWKKGLDNYKKNPVILFQHDHNKPIGTCTNITIDDKGLFIEANISSAAEKLYGTQTLIRDGALKAFSVGFIPKRGKKDSATDTLYITELELLENSVVSVPMQQDSLFSVVKSLKEAGVYDEWLTENVEVFDSSKPKDKAAVTIEINVVNADTNNGEQIGEVEESEEEDPQDPQDPQDPTMSMSATIIAPVEAKIYDVDSNLMFSALQKIERARLNGKNFIIVNQNFETQTLGLQEVSILGNPIGEILNIDINTLNILNLTKVDTSDYVVLKMVEKRSDEEIGELFANLVKVDIKDLKTALTQDQSLSNIAKKQLSYTIDLMEKPIKNWNPDDYIVANKIVDYILSRSHLEAEDAKTLLMLHGHVEENFEMTQETVTQVADEEVTQVASVPGAQASSVSVAEPAVMGLVGKTGEALMAVDAAREDMVPASQLKALEERFERFMSQYTANADKIAAANNAKIAYDAQSAVKLNPKDLMTAKAVILGSVKNPSAQGLSLESVGSTKFGRNLLVSQKATITSVDALITDFSAELYEQMQIELKVANMLPSMDVTAQNFKLPVADEDTNGDIAQFANGTYNVGETDSTRVPTTRQNSISAVNLTPHKFMGTTHLAKDEQEDVLIPLLDFQVRSLTRRMARAVDKSLLRGDGSLSGFTASPTNTIVAGTGYASVITGLCPLAYNGGSALRIASGGASTKATPTTIASARSALGRYGLDVGSKNIVYMTSIEGYNDLVTTSDFRTMDKFGDQATYITGQVGSIYGIPVVISEFLDVVGVSGNHIGLLVYLPGFMVGRRRAFEIESYYDPRRQLTAIYLSTRFDMKALTTNASAALDTTKYNMAAVVTAS